MRYGRSRPSSFARIPFFFGIIAFDRLYLKVREVDRTAFVMAGGEPIVCKRRGGQAVMDSYWTCLDSALAPLFHQMGDDKFDHELVPTTWEFSGRDRALAGQCAAKGSVEGRGWQITP